MAFWDFTCKTWYKHTHAMKITNEIENPSWCGSSNTATTNRNAKQKWLFWICLPYIHDFVVSITHLFMILIFFSSTLVSLLSLKTGIEREKMKQSKRNVRQIACTTRGKAMNSICIGLTLEGFSRNIYFFIHNHIHNVLNETMDRHMHAPHARITHMNTRDHMQSNAKPVNGYDYDNTHMYISIVNIRGTDMQEGCGIAPSSRQTKTTTQKCAFC